MTGPVWSPGDLLAVGLERGRTAVVRGDRLRVFRSAGADTLPVVRRRVREGALLTGGVTGPDVPVWTGDEPAVDQVLAWLADGSAVLPVRWVGGRVVAGPLLEPAGACRACLRAAASSRGGGPVGRVAVAAAAAVPPRMTTPPATGWLWTPEALDDGVRTLSSSLSSPLASPRASPLPGSAGCRQCGGRLPTADAIEAWVRDGCPGTAPEATPWLPSSCPSRSIATLPSWLSETLVAAEAPLREHDPAGRLVVATGTVPELAEAAWWVLTGDRLVGVGAAPAARQPGAVLALAWTGTPTGSSENRAWSEATRLVRERARPRVVVRLDEELLGPLRERVAPAVVLASWGLVG